MAINIEIEAKMRLREPEAVLARLKSLGAKRQDAIIEHNEMFDTPDGRFKATDQGLRLRVESGEDGAVHAMTITHKGPRAHGLLKSRSEIEININNHEAGTRLLQALGYRMVLSFEKRRTRYMLSGCEIAIDELPFLGQYIEIEGPSEDVVIEVRRKLQLDDEPLIRSSYISIMLAYLRDHQIVLDHVGFNEAQQVLVETGV